MNNTLLVFLDYFFLIFHTVFTLFNMSGWVWKKTRKIHLFTVLATALSWFVVGVWKGWGYCFCTDWHWQVRVMLGKPVTSNSYIHFLVKETTGLNVSPEITDIAVLTVFITVFLLALYFNLKNLFRKLFILFTASSRKQE